MNDRQEDYLSMLRTLLAIRALFATEIAAMADMDGDWDDLDAEVSVIKQEYMKQVRQTKGITRDKEDVKEELIDMAVLVAGAVKALASKNSNYTLFEEVNYTRTDLERLRDEVLGDTCRIIHTKATDNAAALVARGITAAVLTDFMALITENGGMSAAPRTATTQKGTATIDLDKHYDEAMKIVKERLDEGMKVFLLTVADIYTTYKKGRKIVNSGRRKTTSDTTGSLAITVKDESNNPIEHVFVAVGDLLRTTDELGKVKIKGIEPGSKVVGFKKTGYEKKLETVSIVVKTTVTLNVQLIATTFGEIRGMVTQGGNPVQANITVIDGISTITTHTHPDGSFKLTGVSAGPQVVTSNLDGDPANFVSHNVTVVAGDTVVQNFAHT